MGYPGISVYDISHIELIKSVAHLMNDKDVFFCILPFHTRVGLLRHYERLPSEVEGFPDEPADEYAADRQILCDRNFNVACAACHAEHQRDAPAVFSEIYLAGCPMISRVIPPCVWDILINCHLYRAPMTS